MALSVGNANPGTITSVGNANPGLISGVGNSNGTQYTSLLPPAPATLGVHTTAPTSKSVAAAAPAAPVIDPNMVAQYNQSIANTQAAINRLPGQAAAANSGIDASFSNAINALLLGKNQGETAYNTNKTQATQGYVAGKNTVSANAGNSLNGLLRLLGSRGAGGGTAYNITAPGAVAREASLQRNDLASTFGANNQALDTNWQNFLTGYNNQVNSATNQRDSQKSANDRSSKSQQASLLQTIAQLVAQRTAYTGGNSAAASQPYLNQANSLLDSIANFSTAPITYQTNAYTAPSQASYTTNPFSTPTNQGQPAPNDYFNPAFTALLGKKQLVAG